MLFPARRRLCFLSLFFLLPFLVILFLVRPRPRINPYFGVKFVDIARQAGLHYTFVVPGPRPLTILGTIGNGCAFLDYDNSGNVSILLIDTNHVALYKGDGQGHFQDVSHAVGLDKLRGHFLGCAVGDYDNDGYDDLYLSGYHTGVLLHNEEGQYFRDVTAEAGLKPQSWGTSCGFADLFGDGRLDLFIANYVKFGVKDRQLCDEFTIPTSCAQWEYNAEKPTLYRNLGAGRFADVSQSSGVQQSEGRGLAVAFAQSKQGHPDILVANDLFPGDFFHNDGSGHFVDRGIASGTAFDAQDKPHSGMGADWADADGDGRLDAIVTTLEMQNKSLYHNEGGGVFTDISERAGLDHHAAPYVTFGVKWLDYDNDGLPDLIMASGHIEDNIAQIVVHPTADRPINNYRLPTQIFHNEGKSTPWGSVHFRDVSSQMGSALQKPIVGRGLAVGDFDNDGRIDALIVDAEGPPLLLHNEGGRVGHWLGLHLIGTGRSNRDAYGASVTVTAGGRTLVKEVQTAGSYLSASDKRLLFGLGEATRIESATIRWPDGKMQTVTGLRIGQYQTIREP